MSIVQVYSTTTRASLTEREEQRETERERKRERDREREEQRERNREREEQRERNRERGRGCNNASELDREWITLF
jgi:hypothetical protein